MLPVVLTVLTLGASLQDPGGVPAPQGPDDRRPASVDVTDLRQRIRDMRANVLLGGDKVRQAQDEAADFYKRKVGEVDRQIDSAQIDLSEKRAAYQLALDRTLEGKNQKARSAAIKEAAELRGQVRALEGDSERLRSHRKRLAVMIDRVEAHGRERDRLAARLDSVSEPSELLTLPLPPVGLAPDVEDPAAAATLDDGLVRDLMARDPRRARRVLFEADPVLYWRRFPLRPPADALGAALTFPPADLPRQR